MSTNGKGVSGWTGLGRHWALGGQAAGRGGLGLPFVGEQAEPSDSGEQ